ncbi:MAG: PAS domain S-box protein [Natrialbaceae archaeon]|nr:PAS domain S-box protein [Natrialbaceae archaeon]
MRPGHGRALRDGQQGPHGQDRLQREELLGRHVATVLTKDSFERGMDHMASLMDSSATEAVTYEVVVESRDGEEIPAEAHSSLLWSDGEIEGTVGTVRDIRERKRIESELTDRTQKIETLHQIVALLEECKTEEEIFEMTVTTAEGVLEFDDCFIELVEDDELVTQFVSSTAKEESGHVLPSRSRSPVRATELTGLTWSRN